MQILRCAKSSQPISSGLAFSLYCLMEIEIFSFFILRENSTLYENIVNFINQSSNITQMVVIISLLNTAQIVYLLGIIIWIKIKLKQKRNLLHSKVLKLFQLKPYLTFVIFSQINIKGFKQNSKFIQLLAAINLLFLILQLVPLRIIGVSYRFIQKNYIRRKNYSINHWLLILPIIFMLNFYGSLYAAIFLIIRGLIIIYDNFNNLENEEIRKLQWFFPMVSLQLAFLVIIKQYFLIEVFKNIAIFSFIILFTLYSSRALSSHLSLQILKYHIKNSKQLFDTGKQNSLQMTTQPVQMSEKQISDILLQLRIMVEIYKSKLNFNKLQKDSKIQSQNFNNWWMIFNHFILDHKANCNNVFCICNKIKHRSSENQSIEKQIFSNKIYDIISKIKSQSINNNKFKIIQNYFLIQLQNKPLKTYSQIIKLSNTHLNTEETLEVENLIHETRDNFKQLFLRQKVQNTDLDVEPLFQFQDHLKDMRSRLNDMAVQYRLFYEVFANNFVQMQALKQKTRLLTEFKNHFCQEIDYCLKKFDKSLELMTFCMVYFRFFDEYTNKLQKVEEKAQYLIEAFKIPFSETKRGKVDIFDPHYGAVKADLVFNPGQIASITKIMCNFLGFTHQQLAGQKINKLMPLMFSRNHDKFISNFVQKGKIKFLKFKQKLVFARNSKKFIAPLTIRLKVDYSTSEGMYTVAFSKLSQTKSEFILMNNYGKVEEITQGIFKKFFGKALGEQNSKVKRLCVGKFLLSFNHALKNISETDDRVHQGLLLSSDSQEVLMNYYKFPEFGKVYKGKSQNGQSSSRSVRSANSVQQSYSGTDASRSIDLSDEIQKYSVDLKEALRIYFKNIDYRKITGFRISYRCQDFVTNEFKCKILQIFSIREELLNRDLIEPIKQQILDVGQLIGLEEQQIYSFRIFNQQESQMNNSTKSQKMGVDQQLQNQNQSQNLLDQQKDKTLHFINAIEGGSDTSSIIDSRQKIKKKEIIINSFQQRSIINSTLEISLTILILALAFILIIVCIFSIQLQSNYESLQHDNLVLTNYRIDFLLLLGIQQLGLMYKSYGIQAPKFIEQKKSLFTDKMKQQLVKSSTWINISRDKYQVVMPFVYHDINYVQERPLYSIMVQLYTIFLAAEQLGHYITDNYVSVSGYLLNVTSTEQVMITNASESYSSQIHIIIACYSFVLVLVVVIGIIFRNLALKKQDKVIDYLPFLKPHQAKRNEIFFERFYQINKEAEQINIESIQSIAELINQNHLQINKTSHKYKSEAQKKFKNSENKQIVHENNTRLVRVVKNQKSEITLKIVAFYLFVLTLCLFVIFYSEFFFASADSKFDTYLQLKNSAFLIQLIPCRIIALYFSNVNRILQNETLYQYPESFYRITHDRLFQLQFGLSNQQFYGTQMQEIISDHFNRQICSLIECSNDSTQMSLVKDQQVFYLAYRFANSFAYMRKIIKMLPNMTNPREEVRKWIDQNDILELLETTEFILDLMKRSQTIITDLFTDQINQIGTILLALSLTLIPILIFVLLFFKKQYTQYVFKRLQCTQQIYMHLSWDMLLENNYAIHYFEDKTKNEKKR